MRVFLDNWHCATLFYSQSDWNANVLNLMRTSRQAAITVWLKTLTRNFCNCLKNGKDYGISAFEARRSTLRETDNNIFLTIIYECFSAKPIRALCNELQNPESRKYYPRRFLDLPNDIIYLNLIELENCDTIIAPLKIITWNERAKICYKICVRLIKSGMKTFSWLK